MPSETRFDKYDLHGLSRAYAETQSARRDVLAAMTGFVAIHGGEGGATRELFEALDRANEALVAAEQEASKLSQRAMSEA